MLVRRPVTLSTQIANISPQERSIHTGDNLHKHGAKTTATPADSSGRHWVGEDPLNSSSNNDIPFKRPSSTVASYPISDIESRQAILAKLNERMSNLLPKLPAEQNSADTVHRLHALIRDASPTTRHLLNQMLGDNLMNALNSATNILNTSEKSLRQGNLGISVPITSASSSQLLPEMPSNAPKPTDLSGKTTEVDSTSLANSEERLTLHSTIRELLQLQSPIAQLALKSAASNSMVEGLLNLVSLRLFARLDSQSANQSLNFGFIKSISQQLKQTTSPVATKRVLNEINKLDSNNELLKSLSKLTSHQYANALRSIESSIQQQDSMFFTLPNFMFPNNSEIELHIRHSNEQGVTHQHSASKVWLLDMHLDIAEQGSILAKVKLANASIDLNLYANNDRLMRKARRYLPLLTDRLVLLGLSVNQSGCHIAADTAIQKHSQINHMDTYT